jgi:hypothetical protein
MSSIESQFLESENLSAYEGRWIAILDKKIVADGATIEETYDKVAKMKLSRTPLYHRIPKREEAEVFIL